MHLQPKVGINLSARQLHDEHVVDRFASACDASGLSPFSVCAELTESAFVTTDDYDAYRVLAALRELRIEVAIDGFGSGYSALSYLKHLPVDVVKIDRAFVAGLGADRRDAVLVEAMIRVAHDLGLRVVAEGVETESQLAVLRDLGRDAAQGYLLARPAHNADPPATVERARWTVGGMVARMPGDRSGPRAPSTGGHRRLHAPADARGTGWGVVPGTRLKNATGASLSNTGSSSPWQARRTRARAVGKRGSCRTGQMPVSRQGLGHSHSLRARPCRRMKGERWTPKRQVPRAD